jgi:hypothetical protein
MENFKTPQEKKQLSYKKDHRDSYGESNKGSRKTIPRKKQIFNQRYRQNINQILKKAGNETDQELTENKIKETKRNHWKKSAHEPLGLFLNRKGKLNISKISKVNFTNGNKPDITKVKIRTN